MYFRVVSFLVILVGFLGTVKAASDDKYEKCTKSDCRGKDACVTIYQHRNFGGWYQCLTFRENECIDLNSWWSAGRVSGADSYDTCVRLYEKKSCRGDYLEIKPGSPNGYLNKLSFEDETLSVSSCSRAPVELYSGYAYGNCSVSDCAGKEGCLTVFEDRNFKGRSQCLIFKDQECITLNSQWITGSRVSSVDTHNTCIRLYQWKSCSTYYNYIEINPGSQDQYDLGKLYFDDQAYSASACSREPEWKRNSADFRKCTVSDCSAKGGCITVYEDRNFGGWSQCVSFSKDECITLSYWWTGMRRVSSVDSHGNCFRLYQGANCTGASLKLDNNTLHKDNLNEINFEDATQSISTCLLESDVTVGGNNADECSTSDCVGKSGCVTIYQHRSYGGESQCHKFDNKECISLNEWWKNERNLFSSDGRVSSVKSHGTCIRLYSGHSCDGASIEIKPGTLHQENLNEVHFEEKTRSISSCVRDTDVKLSGSTFEKCSTFNCSGTTGCATIYDGSNLDGRSHCLTFQNNECTELNDWWQGRVRSLDTHNICMRFYEAKRCTGAFVEVNPGSPYYDWHHAWKDAFPAIRSASPCSRQASIYKECSVRDLFSRKIKSDEVSEASEKILSAVDGVASLAVSGFSSVIPGLGTLYSGLKFVTGFFQSGATVEALMDAKIERALVQNSASQISAKIEVINNRLETILSNATPAVDRRIALGLALDRCEEVAKLFEDEEYSFSKSKLLSSPYLVAFSSVYVTVAKLVYEMRPEMRSRVIKDIAGLAKLNEDFMEQAMKERKGKLEVSGVGITIYYMVYDNLPCEFDGYTQITKYEKFQTCKLKRYDSDYERCAICYRAILHLIVTDMENFFRPIINKLWEFANSTINN